MTDFFPIRPISLIPVVVRLLGYSLHDRRENVQYEDHGGHQTRNEEDRSRTGAALSQEP